MRKGFLFLAIIILALTSVASAQFHAPDTEFHDLSQRVFPVEAARVLAWLRQRVQPEIAEVTYSVKTTPHRHTVWLIQWRDIEGKPLREARVQYPEDALVLGPAFFRDVFAQLCGNDWAHPERSTLGFSSAYWKGAGMAGLSRLEGVEAASRFLAGKVTVESAEDAGLLAGLLIHSALPMSAEQMTLDPMLLGRGAAWLCYAEILSGSTQDQLWAPVLSLAGREAKARQSWAKAPISGKSQPTVPEQCWNHIFAAPSIRDSFVFISHPDRQQFALPILYKAVGRSPQFSDEIFEAADAIFPDSVRGRLYEYAPFLSFQSGMEGCAWIDGPGNSIRHWLRALREFNPDARDYTQFKSLLPEDAAIVADGRSDDLEGVRATAPLINDAFVHGKGPLLPVAHVTVGDLLNFGWEMQARQLGRRYYRLANIFADKDAAQTYASQVFSLLTGVEPFFGIPDATGAKVRPVSSRPLADISRLQFQSAFEVSSELAGKDAPVEWRADPEPETAYLRRCWLNGASHPISKIGGSSLTSERLVYLVKRILAESGPFTYGVLLNSTMGPPANPNRLASLPHSKELRRKLAAEAPFCIGERATLLWEDLAAAPMTSWLPFAQALEKMGWDTLRPISPAEVIGAYVQANALDSARKYYDRACAFITDPIVRSKALTYRRWALAWCEGDEAGMLRALRDGASGSRSDLRLRALHAMAHGSFSEAAEIMDLLNERYSERPGDIKLAEFLKLLPSLQQKHHPDRERVLDYYRTDHTAPAYLWLPLRHLKLSPQEAVRFVGGDQSDVTRQLYVAALAKNRDRFGELYCKVDLAKQGHNSAIIIQMLRHELFGTPAIQHTELFPPGLQPLGALVRKELEIHRAQKRQ